MMEQSSKLEVNMVFKGIESSEAVKEYTHRKSEKLARHLDRVTHCRFVFEMSKTEAIAHLHVNCGDFEAQAVAEGEDKNLYSAIDQVVDKIDQQIKKYKAKKGHH